jgi:glutaredoxin
VDETALLFVKSERISRVEYTTPNFGHWCSAAYRAAKTDFVFLGEDEKAIKALEKAQLPYKLVDLSLANPIARIKAKMEGVNTTPTLIYKGQKFRGAQQIVEMLETAGKL